MILGGLSKIDHSLTSPTGARSLQISAMESSITWTAFLRPFKALLSGAISSKRNKRKLTACICPYFVCVANGGEYMMISFSFSSFISSFGSHILILCRNGLEDECWVNRSEYLWNSDIDGLENEPMSIDIRHIDIWNEDSRHPSIEQIIKYSQIDEDVRRNYALKVGCNLFAKVPAYK